MSVVFNKPMDPASLTGTNFSVANGAVAVAGAITVSQDGTTLMFTPGAALAKSSTFTATLKGAVADVTDRPYGAIPGSANGASDDQLMEPFRDRLMEPFDDRLMEPFRDRLMEPSGF
jgi:hypothetical protein